MSASRPTVTVVIPTYNRADYLAECLESILSQDLPASQVIVVNDSSTDHTVEVLRPFRSEIDYLETEEQLSRAGALNLGLAHATGEYVWTFDDDDVALPEAVRRFVEPLDRHPEHAYSFSTFYYSRSGEDGRIGEVLRESTIPDLKTRGPLIPLLEANYLCGAALFARRSAFDAVGHFDPTLLRSQDYELGIRMARAFTGIRVPGPPTFHYRQHDGLRGAARDRFESSQLRRKWLEYDQITFSRLFKELPLADYLPPGLSVSEHSRQARLQRMAVMATKLLREEVLQDLEALTRSPEDHPLTAAERAILDRMFGFSPFYGEGSVYDDLGVFDAVRRLSRVSPATRVVRGGIRRALMSTRLRGGARGVRSFSRGTLRRLARLYLPPLVSGD